MGIKDIIKSILNKRKTSYNLNNEKGLIDGFNNLYYDSDVWKTTYWMGHEIQKTPTDLLIYQEIINELKPDVIMFPMR